MRRFLAGGLPVVLAAPLSAQDMRATITELFTFGDCGAPLCPNLTHEHGNHFIPVLTASNETVIAFFTEAMGRSAANTPLRSSSSGATFRLVGGLPVRTSTSGGPIFAERAQALGRGRFYLGAIRQPDLFGGTPRFASTRPPDFLGGTPRPRFQPAVRPLRTDTPASLPDRTRGSACAPGPARAA